MRLSAEPPPVYAVNHLLVQLSYKPNTVDTT